MLNLLDQFPRKEITKQTYLYISFFTFILIFRTRVLSEVSSESKDIRLDGILGKGLVACPLLFV